MSFKRTYKKRFGQRKGTKPVIQTFRIRKLYILLLVFFLFIFFSTFISSIIIVFYLQGKTRTLPDITPYIEQVSFASTITDRNGEILFRVHNDYTNSDKLSIYSVNPYTVAAFLAAEDDTFFEHNGIRIDAILRCSLIEVTSYGQRCGGSTITQQVVKLLTKNNDPTIDRKVEEILLSSSLEENLSKMEIFELYLNLTPYGSNIVGLKTAARKYFEKKVSDLSLSESIMLAAIVKDPVILAPTSEDYDESELNKRMLYVIDQMIEKKDIINSQIRKYNFSNNPVLTSNTILSEGVKIPELKLSPDTMRSGHFVQYVITELTTKPYNNGNPFTIEEIQTGGYLVQTTLDYEMQKIAERYVEVSAERNKKYNAYNAAVMTAIPSTGEIITMAGSKSFTDESEGCDDSGNNCKFDPEVNVLTSLQSPGSTNKPLGYYLAFNQGILSPGSFLPDVPISFGNYRPKNWDDKFLGTNNAYAKRMLRESRNIPALIVMSLIGVDNYINTAKQFGYTSFNDSSNFGISLILGGGDIYPTEHLQAYSVFANSGIKVNLNPIERILDSEGNIIYQARREGEHIADAAASFLLNQSLLNLDTGVGETISFDDRQIAGKTGTTQDNKDSFLIMYSPDFVTIGWAGNNNNEPMSQIFGWPGFTVAPWLRGYMYEIGQNSDYISAKTPFPKPENVYIGDSSSCTSLQCRIVTKDWMITGREPNYNIFTSQDLRQALLAFSAQR